MTFQKVLDLFGEYLRSDSCIEVVETRWGFARLFCELPYKNSFEAVLCRTPEELFQELLDNLIANREYELRRDGGNEEEKIAEVLNSLRQSYCRKLEGDAQ